MTPTDHVLNALATVSNARRYADVPTVVHLDHGYTQFYGPDGYWTMDKVMHCMGDLPAKYPVPALMTDTLYWRLPKGTNVNELIAAYYLWRQGRPHRFYGDI